MKKRILTIIIIMMISVFVLAACNAGSVHNDKSSSPAPGYENADDYIENVEKDGDIDGPNIDEHKIIYKASAQIYTDDLGKAVAAIRGALDKSAGEWFDNESVSDNNAYFTARVKSENLDEFLETISQVGTVRNYNKSASNISLQYAQTEHRIESLLAEYNRLTELKSKASMGELLQIEQRQSQINYELVRLQGALNQYDSLIEYSEVTLNVYEQSPPEPVPFGERVKKVFSGAWKALRVFLEWIVIVVTAIFPFLVVFVPIGAGVAVAVVFYKKRKGKLFRRKKSDKNAKEDGNNNKDDK